MILKTVWILILPLAIIHARCLSGKRAWVLSIIHEDWQVPILNQQGGFVIRGWDGRFLQAATFNLGAASVLVIEATTMRNGLRAAVRVGFTDIHIEGDNRILIQAVNSSTTGNSSARPRYHYFLR